MTNLKTKIIAGVIGIALTTTVGATAVMHNQNKTDEVKAEVTTTTTTTSDKEFIPVKTEPELSRVNRIYNVDIKGNELTVYEISISNYGEISIQYEKSVEDSDKPTPIPISMKLTDEDGTEGREWGVGNPSIGFEGINPLSKSFTLTIAFEDLEEQTIEIVLPEEYTQK